MKAFELLADPKNWIKGAIAKDTFGVTHRVFHPDSTRFCISGAILRVYHSEPGDSVPIPTLDESVKIILDRVTQELVKRNWFTPESVETTGYPHITFWNDLPSTAHAQIIDVLTVLDL